MVKGDEPVAKRTRLRSGAPMFKTKPVQYPPQWLSGRPKGRGNSDAESSSDSEDESRASSRNKYLPSTSKAACERDAQKKTTASGKKQLRSSLIQLVKVKSSRPQDGRRSKPRRKGRAVQKAKKKTRGEAVHKPHRLLLRRVQEWQDRKPAFTRCPPLGHELDDDLTKWGKDKARHIDNGHKEDIEDPLNVKRICRSLVKSLQGRPIDERDITSPENGDKSKQQGSDEPQPSKEIAKKKNQKNRRRSHKTKHRKRNYTRGHQKKRPVMQKGRSHKKGALLRRKNVKHSHRWVGHNRRPHRAKDVHERRKFNRLAEVARRRKHTRR
ncbi:hypothetical protein Btru_053078 [Bulinus truncatus]|nr:hypothetical protein Btru_053078 [Bulinus truncatus]